MFLHDRELPIIMRIQNVQPLFGLILNFENKIVDIVTESLTMLSSYGQVCRETAIGIGDIGSLVPWTILCIWCRVIVYSGSQTWQSIYLGTECWDDTLGASWRDRLRYSETCKDK